MRSGPLGALYWDDPTAPAAVVMESSLTTHGDIRAAAIAYAVACAVAGFVAGRPAAAIASALPGAVAEVEADWLTGHMAWQHDRTGAHAVSAGLASLLADLDVPTKVLRNSISAIARPGLAPGFTRAQPNQGYALLGGAHALAMALRPAAEPRATLAEVIQQGYDTDTVAAICGSLLAAQFGSAWIPVDRFVDRPRLTAYADALVERGGLPEDLAGFMQREAALTAAEAAFQALARA